jgi:hypothetical protein
MSSESTVVVPKKPKATKAAVSKPARESQPAPSSGADDDDDIFL